MKRSKKLIAAEEGLPTLRKLTPGTLILNTSPNRRVKPKEKIRVDPKVLGRKALEFEVVDEGSGKFKTTYKDLKKIVKEAEESYRKMTNRTDGPIAFKESLLKKKKGEKAPDDEEYVVKHFGGGKYNVLSPEGKKMSEAHITKKEAKTLKDQLDTSNE